MAGCRIMKAFATAQGAATGAYLNAFDLLEAGNPGAIAAFAALVGNRPDDALAGFHLRVF
jgi:adenylate cyclase